VKNFSPLLSVYIPAYNHGKIIEDNLNFIAQEIRKISANNDIEIAISDNASNDDTEQKIKNFIQKNNDLIVCYSRNTENIGGIRNIMNLWNKTTGRYVVMIGDDCFAKSGLVNIYSSVKENIHADLIILKNNNYTDFEYIKNANLTQTIKHFKKLQYIGNFVLKRSCFGLDFKNCAIDFNNAYPHLIMIMEKIAAAKTTVDTRFIAVNVNISWNFYKTIKVIYKLQIDCLKIAEMAKNGIGLNNYKLLTKQINKEFYKNLRFIRGHKNRFLLVLYILRALPHKNPKIVIGLIIHSFPAPLFYFFKLLSEIFKSPKYCITEIRQNRVRWKNKEFLDFQDHPTSD
jgi:glycosyltransferase involved in cell wall biosynthesis